jgi:hypothetical protein
MRLHRHVGTDRRRPHTAPGDGIRRRRPPAGHGRGRGVVESFEGMSDGPGSVRRDTGIELF